MPVKQWSIRKKIWLFSSLISGLPAILGFLQYAIIGLTSLFPAWDYIPLGRFFLVFAVLEAIIGYFMGDALVAEYRHRTQNFTDSLPQNILNTRHIRRTPFWVGAGVHVFLCILCSLIFSF